MTAVQIKEFQSLGSGYWRINLHGEITFPELAGSEPRMWVSLSLLRDDYVVPFKAESLAQPEKHVELQVKIGFISHLIVGSVWKDGIRQIPPRAATASRYTNFHWSQFKLVRFDQQVEIGGKKFSLFGEGRYRVGTRAWQKIKGSWFAVAQGFENSFGGGLLVIPSTVLFQAGMVTSPTVARRLVFGELNKILDEECSFVEGEPGTLKVTVAKDIRSVEDAPAAANIRVDPVAGEAYKLMRQHIVATQVNRLGCERHEDGVHLCLGVPFSHPIDMEVAGKPLAFKGIDAKNPEKIAWGFLVTEILTLKVDLPFTRLVVERKNSGAQGSNANDEDLASAWSAARPSKAEPLEPAQPVTSEREPSSCIDEIPISVFGGFTPRHLEVIHEPKLVQRYRSARLSKASGVDFEGLATTGDPVSNGGVASINTTLVQAELAPLALEQVLNAFSILNASGLNIRTIAVGPLNRFDEQGRVTNFFTNSPRRGRSWRNMPSNSSSRTRGFAVGELHIGGVWHYLIDIEHKRSGELSILHLRSEDNSQISPRSLHFFMESVARLNGWRAKDRYAGIWRFQSFRHTQKTAEGLAKLIKKIF